MKCKNCGKNFESELNFCPRCGESIKTYKIIDRRETEENKGVFNKSFLKDLTIKSKHSLLKRGYYEISIVVGAIFLLDWAINYKFSFANLITGEVSKSSLNIFNLNVRLWSHYIFIFRIIVGCVGFFYTVMLVSEPFEFLGGLLVIYTIGTMFGAVIAVLAGFFGPIVFIVVYKLEETLHF